MISLPQKWKESMRWCAKNTPENKTANSQEAKSPMLRCFCKLAATAALALAAFLPTLAFATAPTPGNILVADSEDGNGHGVILQVNPKTGAQSVWASGGFL